MSNGNVSGNNEDRKRRRQWLLETYRADVDLLHVTVAETDKVLVWTPRSTADQASIEFDLINDRFYSEVVNVPTCRCYRCGTLLTIDTVTVDRIIPGALGGTYRRNNIRPACKPCNDSTGGKLGASRVKR